jgi:hypothetical protein
LPHLPQMLFRDEILQARKTFVNVCWKKSEFFILFLFILLFIWDHMSSSSK